MEIADIHEAIGRFSFRMREVETKHGRSDQIQWLYRLTARTQDSHSCNRGSIPRRVTDLEAIFINVFLDTL